MLTKSGHGESLLRHGVARICSPSNCFSLRLRHAPIGAAALFSIVGGVLMLPVATLFLGKGTSLGTMLAIVIFLVPPATLSTIHSLFFEKSKVYGSLGLLLAGIVLLVQPLTWDWLNLFLPFACAFTVFCAVVWVLEHRRKR